MKIVKFYIINSWNDLAEWIISSHRYIQESTKSFGIKLNVNVIQIISNVNEEPVKLVEERSEELTIIDIMTPTPVNLIDTNVGTVIDNKSNSRKRKNNELSNEWVNRRSNRV